MGKENTIQEMIDAGMSPEKIYQEALRITEAKNAAAARIRIEKIAKTRGALLTAIGNYTEAVTGKPVDKKFMEDTAKVLISIEDNAGKKCNNKSKECKCKNEQFDLNNFIKFLDMMEAMIL